MMVTGSNNEAAALVGVGNPFPAVQLGSPTLDGLNHPRSVVR